MKVLVTGGAGFIGSHLVEELVKNEYDVTVLDNFSSGRKENLLSPPNGGKLSLVKGDIRDGQIVKRCLKDTDSVVHLAAISSVPYSIEHRGATLDVNVSGTLNLLQACARCEVDTLVFASSSAVYGEAHNLPTKENEALSPLSPYAESKVLGERACQTFQKDTGLRTVCFRLFNVYGTNHFTSYNGGVIAQFVSRLGRGQPPIIYGNGRQTRDFIHVKDVTRALAMALGQSWSGETLNLGSGKTIAMNELAEKMIRLVGARCGGPERRTSRPGDIGHSQADTALIMSRMGFQPRIPLSEGLTTLLMEQLVPLDGLIETSRQQLISRVDSFRTGSF